PGSPGSHDHCGSRQGLVLRRVLSLNFASPGTAENERAALVWQPDQKSRQKVNFSPNCAANGIPTVVPGPKKSPSAPPGTFNCLALVMGFVCEQSAFKQNAVAFVR